MSSFRHTLRQLCSWRTPTTPLNSRLCFPSVSSSSPLSLDANKLTSLTFPSPNNLLSFLISVKLRAPQPLSPSILHFDFWTLSVQYCKYNKKNLKKKAGSLEVACSNGFLAFCFIFVFPCPSPAPGCVVTCSLHSFSSDRSNTLNRSSYARDSMMIEEILAPTKDTVR